MDWYKTSEFSNKKPWEMTQDEFLSYHHTGNISIGAYEKYKTVDGLSWLKKEEYPILYSVKEFGGKLIEFRKSGEKLKFVRHDENDEIARGPDGLALFLTDDEALQKGYKIVDTTIVAFDGDTAIGWVSDEWGTDGVWVIDDYQHLGIGTYLLYEMRKNWDYSRKIGQMTGAGKQLARSLYRRYIEEALSKGIDVSDDVLKDYPELEGNNVRVTEGENL